MMSGRSTITSIWVAGLPCGNRLRLIHRRMKMMSWSYSDMPIVKVPTMSPGLAPGGRADRRHQPVRADQGQLQRRARGRPSLRRRPIWSASREADDDRVAALEGVERAGRQRVRDDGGVARSAFVIPSPVVVAPSGPRHHLPVHQRRGAHDARHRADRRRSRVIVGCRRRSARSRGRLGRILESSSVRKPFITDITMIVATSAMPMKEMTAMTSRPSRLRARR